MNNENIVYALGVHKGGGLIILKEFLKKKKKLLLLFWQKVESNTLQENQKL